MASMKDYGVENVTLRNGASTSGFLANGYGKVTVYVYPSSGATGTYTIRASPNRDSANWVDLPSASVTLTGAETGTAGATVYTVDAVAPYIRVNASAATAGTFSVWFAFNRNN